MNPLLCAAVLVEELRYPFSSLIDFLAYAQNPSALIILIGFIALIRISFVSISGSPNLYTGFAICSLVTSPFNNPAYTLFSIAPSDVFGFLSIATLLYATSHRPLSLGTLGARGLFSKIFPYLLLFVGSIIGFSYHSFINSSSYLTFDSSYFITSNLRLLVSTGVCIAIFGVSRAPFRDLLLKAITECVWWILFCQLLGYLLFFLLGIAPYGTFQGAGFIDFPAFGIFSIERGHLGRIIVFFPILLLVLGALSLREGTSLYNANISSRKLGLAFAASLLSVILTFSASAYIVFSVFLVSLTLLKFLFYLTRFKLSFSFAWLLFIILLLTPLLSLYLYPVFSKVIDMTVGGSGEVRAINGLFDGFRIIGSGYYGSQGRTQTGLQSYDLGFVVSSFYFGIFYIVFLLFIFSTATSCLISRSYRIGLDSLLFISSYLAFLVFGFSEVSIAQLTSIALWFSLP